MSSIARQNHKRASSGFPVAPPEEDLEGQLDRLNQGLQLLMNEIEATSCSRNPSSLSMLDSQHLPEEDRQSDSSNSEDNLLPAALEARLEEFLLSNDRNQMIIEDFRSEEFRRLTFPEYQNNIFINELRKEIKSLKEKLTSGNHCTHDLNRLRKEIWLQVKMQKSEQIDKERKRFEENLEHLDQLKEEYEKKRAEIMLGIEKLKLKEELLVQKEKEAREQRVAFDRHKILWCRDHGISDPYAPKLQSADPVEDQGTFTFKADKSLSHARASSFSDVSSLFGKRAVLSSEENTPNGKDSEKPRQLPMKLGSEPEFSNKSEQLRFYQAELKVMEIQLQKKSGGTTEEISRLEMNIDQLKNRIATLRGDIAMTESAKATKIISNMMVTMSREAIRDEKLTRGIVIETLNKKVLERSPHLLKPSERFPIKATPIDTRMSNVSEVQRLVVDTGNSKTVLGVRGEENSKTNYDYQRKALFDKEKEIIQREALLQQTWMKVPGAKELIDNVNLTLSKMNSEKQRFEKEREEFEKEKLDWIRNKEKSMMQARKRN